MHVYSYIRVLPDGFLLKAIVFTVCEHEYMNIQPPPPQLSRLVSALFSRGKYFRTIGHSIDHFIFEPINAQDSPLDKY